MRKIVGIIFVLLSVLLLAGCSNGTSLTQENFDEYYRVSAYIQNGSLIIYVTPRNDDFECRNCSVQVDNYTIYIEETGTTEFSTSSYTLPFSDFIASASGWIEPVDEEE